MSTFCTENVRVSMGRTYGCIFRHPYVRAIQTTHTHGPHVRVVRIGLKLAAQQLFSICSAVMHSAHHLMVICYMNLDKPVSYLIFLCSAHYERETLSIVGSDSVLWFVFVSMECVCCRHWFLVFTGCIFSMCFMGDFFGGYMLHYIGWDWLIACGLSIVVLFTVVSGFVLFSTVCFPSYMSHCFGFISIATHISVLFIPRNRKICKDVLRACLMLALHWPTNRRT